MTTDQLYIDGFKVGDKYNELFNKVVSSVLDIVEECVDGGTVANMTLSEIVTDETEKWLGGWFMYPLYVTLHFGIYDVVGGCDYEDSPSWRFTTDVQERVKSLLEDEGIEVEY